MNRRLMSKWEEVKVEKIKMKRKMEILLTQLIDSLEKQNLKEGWNS
jgi:hypothetical protein